MTPAKLKYRTEDLLRRALNEFALPDKTFRVSAPGSFETVKYIFGNQLSERQLNALSGHDGYVALFVNDTVRGNSGMEMKPDVVKARRGYAGRSKPAIELLNGFFGSKPLIEIQQGIDVNPNIFGAQSIYVCCIWGLDETGFMNRIT